MSAYQQVQRYPSYEKLYRTENNDYSPNASGPEQQVTYYLELWVKKSLAKGN
jgi:hypothetical protein